MSKYKGKHYSPPTRRGLYVLAAFLVVAVVIILFAPNASGRTLSGINYWQRQVNDQLADHEQRISDLEAAVWPTIPPTTTSSVPGPTSTTTTNAPTTTSVPTTVTTTAPTTTTTIPPTTTSTVSTTTTSTTVPTGTIGPLELQDNQLLENVTVEAGYATIAVGAFNVQGAVIRNVTVLGEPDYGLKVGSSSTMNQLNVDGLTIPSADTGIYLDCVTDSVFSNLDITSPRYDYNQDHTMYIESDVTNVVIKDSVFRGGSGYTLHMYREGGGQSHDILFENVTIDASTGRYPVVIGSGFDHVTFRNCTFIARPNADEAVFQMWGVDSILVDGFTASGGTALVSASGTNIVFRNGTYEGPSLGTGATFDNVSLGGL